MQKSIQKPKLSRKSGGLVKRYLQKTELGNRELKTAEKIAARLKSLAIEVQGKIAYTYFCLNVFQEKVNHLSISYQVEKIMLNNYSYLHRISFIQIHFF